MKLYHQDENGEKFVRWAIFIWAIGIIFMLFTVLSGSVLAMQNKLETYKEQQNANNLEIKTQLSQIQSDLQWLKNALNK